MSSSCSHVQSGRGINIFSDNELRTKPSAYSTNDFSKIIANLYHKYHGKVGARYIQMVAQSLKKV